jgi:Stress responsive A/B Barrel Domain
MIRHIVTFTFAADDLDQRRADALEAKRRLEALNDLVPDILRLEVGIDLGLIESHGHAVLVSDFAEYAHVEAYQVHPAHVEASNAVAALSKARVAVDYEV